MEIKRILICEEDPREAFDFINKVSDTLKKHGVATSSATHSDEVMLSRYIQNEDKIQRAEMVIYFCEELITKAEENLSSLPELWVVVFVNDLEKARPSKPRLMVLPKDILGIYQLLEIIGVHDANLNNPA